MKALDVVVAILLVVGALNLGIMGFFSVNVLSMIFGEATALTRTVYALIGLSGLYEIGSFMFDFQAVQHRWCEMPSTERH